MSLVGPRPMMPGQAGLYPGRAYYGLRPGLTGFWQISRPQRDHLRRPRRLRHRSMPGGCRSLTDLLVLLATVWVVLRGTGY